MLTSTSTYCCNNNIIQ